MERENQTEGNVRRRNQRTLARAVSLDGFGFWTGQDVRLTFAPARVDGGIRFIRTDLPEAPPLPARIEFRAAKPRQTSLARGVVRVDMIEHVMAALAGAQIDNCDILINGPEMPGFDGSGLPFFHALGKAGAVEQPAKQPVRVIRRSCRFGDETSGIEIAPVSDGVSVFSYALRYASPVGDQFFRCALTPETFEREVASARTFLLHREAEQLLAFGLCGRVSERDVLVFGEKGPIGNTLRFPDEPARHKVLDMIGDFALCGVPIIGRISATRTGHQQNADALAEILEMTECE